MQDIATMFSAPVFSQLEDSVEADIPSVDSVLTVNTTRSILSELSLEQQGKLNARADEIALELGGYELGDRFSVRAKFNEKRIRNLRGELVTIFVGGETYSDVKERIDRFEDVVKAVKSALVNGVVPGVGSSLVTAGARAIMKQTTALSIPDVSKALFGSLDILSGKFKPATEEEINVQFQILLKLALLCWSPYLHLMSQVDGKPMKNPASTNTIGGDIIPNCVNLATGAKGTSEELGVYDTAFATITALKGGLQTAKILANASSILLGEKLSAVRVNV
jgi:chaperonin GroEL (HSP60 family)